MATHSSILAWRIPQTEEPGGLPSMAHERFRHNLETKQIHLLTETEKDRARETEKRILLTSFRSMKT